MHFFQKCKIFSKNLLFELRFLQFQRLVRVGSAPFSELFVTDDLAEFLVLLGVVLIQGFHIDLSAKTCRRIAGTHAGTTRTALSTRTSHSRAFAAAGSAGFTVAAARESATISHRGYETTLATRTVNLKILATVLDILLHKLVDLLGLLLIEGEIADHLVGTGAGFLLDRRTLFRLRAFTASGLRSRRKRHSQRGRHKNKDSFHH